MRLRLLARLLLPALAALGVAACQYSPDIVDRTIAYNRAVADSTNQLLLLNILRNAQRLPTYYSRLEGDTASASINPSLSLTQPFGRGHSLETDTAAGGAIALKETTALNAITSLLGLQGTESNTLNLQTLDDQKYQQGMMSPVSLRIFKAFFDEGYSQDLLMYLFVARIRVRHDLVATLDGAVGERCGQLGNDPSVLGAFEGQACHYRDVSGAAGQLAACMPPSGDDRAMVAFDNDPAHEAQGGRHPQLCFERLVMDLLILGAAVNPTGNETYRFIDGPVTASLANDPHFRAQLLQQGFTLLPAVRGNGHGGMARDSAQWVVCEKDASPGGFSLSVPASRKGAGKPLDILATALKMPETAPHTDSYQRTCAIVPDPPATKPAPEPAGTPIGPRTVALSSSKIEFTIRSFESMMYFLGEIARTDLASGDPAMRPVLIPILGRNPEYSQTPSTAYWDTLFYVSKNLASADTALSIKDDHGQSYAVPKPCLATPGADVPALASGRSIACSAEYPDNESLVVLNLMNEVWGLQKEQASSPAAAVIISP